MKIQTCFRNPFQVQGRIPQGLKCVREDSVVPPGLESSLSLFPALKRRAIVSRPSGARINAILSHRFGQNLVLAHTLKPVFLLAHGGAVGEAAEKVQMLTSAPKGAIDGTRLAASLKRCPDTKPSLSATSEAVPYPKPIFEKHSLQ